MKLRALIKDFIAMPVDILVGDAPVLLEATKTIPIVSETMSDPVRNGLVASLARPGGNLTGVSAQTYDLWPKRLQFARELVPKLKRLYFLFDTNDEPYSLTYADTEFKSLAAAEGVTVRNFPVATLDDLQMVLDGFIRRIVKSKEFLQHNPELFALHASLVILIACGTVVAFVVPVTVHPLLLGLVPGSIGILGSLAVANYHHRG